MVLLGAMAGLGSPWIGAVLLLAFGRGRGLPVALGAMSIGWLENLHRLAPYVQRHSELTPLRHEELTPMPIALQAVAG